MKKVLLFIICFSLMSKSFEQNTSNQTLDKSYYIQKSKHQKTTGWILLGGGSIITIVGIGTAVAGTLNDISGYGSQHNATAGTIMTLLGVGAMVGSISFFIRAKKNKRIASSISFSNFNIPVFQQNIVSGKIQPGVTLKISLR